MHAVATWTLLAPGNTIIRLQQSKYHETYEKFGPTNVIGIKNNTKNNTKAKKLIYNGSRRRAKGTNHHQNGKEVKNEQLGATLHL
jgi:hypothetical protein